jgi:RNA polymerase sigma factor (sigma-70 family)
MWNSAWLNEAMPCAACRVKNWLCRSNWSPARAEELALDAVQEAVLRARDGIYSDKAHFTNALTRIAMNWIIDQLRRPNVQPLPTDWEPPSSDQVELRKSSELEEDLLACLKQLSVELQNVFLRLYQENMEIAEIGHALNLSRRTIYRRLREAIIALRKCLAAKGWSEADL